MVRVEEQKLLDLQQTLAYVVAQQRSHRDQQKCYEMQMKEAISASMGSGLLLQREGDKTIEEGFLNETTALDEQVAVPLYLRVRVPQHLPQHLLRQACRPAASTCAQL